MSDVSLAQLVYQSTGALLPRDMQRFDSGVRWLRRKGLKPSQASMLCAVMNSRRSLPSASICRMGRPQRRLDRTCCS